MRSMVAPQADNLSSSRSKPRRDVDAVDHGLASAANPRHRDTEARRFAIA